MKSVVAQLKIGMSAQGVKRPIAPPVYRPQPPPKVMQGKMRYGAANRKPPVAPSVYRPQQAPKVLQTKRSAGQSPQAGQAPRQPVAPPVYRRQKKPVVAQAKAANPCQIKTSPTAPQPYRPQRTPKVLQAKDRIDGSVRPTIRNQAKGIPSVQLFEQGVPRQHDASAKLRPAAPQIYRPQPLAACLQSKRCENLGRALNPNITTKAMMKSAAANSRRLTPLGLAQARLNAFPKLSAIQRSSTKEQVEASKKEGSEEKPASKETLASLKGVYFRYVNTTNELDFQPPNKSTGEKWYKALQGETLPEEMNEILATHMGGDKTGSPFVSVTSDFNLAAQTTDNSSNGLAQIVNSVKFIAVLKFPSPKDGGPYTFTCTGGLPAKEGEVLVLLPPGKTLANYVTAVGENIYKGKQWKMNQ
jgi:hypothetical protein